MQGALPTGSQDRAYFLSAERLDTLYHKESGRPLSARYSDYKRTSKISYPFFSTLPKSSADFQEVCSSILNAFTDGCEVQSFLPKLLDYAPQFPTLREKAVEIYILSTSRNLSLLYPRNMPLETEFLSLSKALFAYPLGSVEKALALSATILQEKEKGFARIRLDMIETETPKPSRMPLPNLAHDITFNSSEIMNNPLDTIEKTLTEIYNTEIHFNAQLKSLLSNPLFQLHQNHSDYHYLFLASENLIQDLGHSTNEKARFLACLEAFAADRSHPYFLAFKKPIQLGPDINRWLEEGKIDASSILISPVQRPIKIKLLLERLHATCNVGPAKEALGARIDNVKKWLALYNLL